MKIIDKLNAKQDIYGEKPVTIAFLGDSVTQGCFECYIKEDGKIETGMKQIKNQILAIV